MNRVWHRGGNACKMCERGVKVKFKNDALKEKRLRAVRKNARARAQRLAHARAATGERHGGAERRTVVTSRARGSEPNAAGRRQQNGRGQAASTATERNQPNAKCGRTGCVAGAWYKRNVVTWGGGQAAVERATR